MAGKAKNKSKYIPETRVSNMNRRLEKKIKMFKKRNPDSEYKVEEVKGRKKTGYNIVKVR